MIRIYAVEQRFPQQPWQLFAVRPIQSEAQQFCDSLQAAAGTGTKYRVREYAPVASDKRAKPRPFSAAICRHGCKPRDCGYCRAMSPSEDEGERAKGKR